MIVDCRLSILECAGSTALWIGAVRKRRPHSVSATLKFQPMVARRISVLENSQSGRSRLRLLLQSQIGNRQSTMSRSPLAAASFSIDKILQRSTNPHEITRTSFVLLRVDSWIVCFFAFG